MPYIDSLKADPVWAEELEVGDRIRFNGGREHVITHVGWNVQQALVDVTIKDVDTSETADLYFAPDTEVWRIR